MEERIAARIAELERAEKETETRLIIIRNLIIELHNLIAPAAPVMSGDSLDERDESMIPLRDERDMLMSRLGEAHQTIDIAEEHANGL
jgi:hypothetical protein